MESRYAPAGNKEEERDVDRGIRSAGWYMGAPSTGICIPYSALT